MSGVTHRAVAAEDAGIRLDRWFKRHFPGVSHIQLEKLLRTGQIRVDGGRAKANARLEEGQDIRIPPLGEAPPGAPKRRSEALDERLDNALQALVFHKTDKFLALNKPAGLAVQGGTGTAHHLDRLIGAHEAVTGEKLRLVHRLDRDTSGVLLLGRTAQAAAELAALFRSREIAKLYWALTAGIPKMPQGRIDQALAKRAQAARGGYETMAIAHEDEADAVRAVTDYAVMAKAGRIGWLALRPITGRTHQLRAHLAALQTPIVGDPKYGGAAARIGGALAPGLMLHARAIALPGPGASALILRAPLTGGMKDAFKLLGFDDRNATDPFD